MGVPSLAQGAEGAAEGSDGATEGVSTVAGTEGAAEGSDGATEGVSTVAAAEGAASGAEGAVVAGMDGTTVTVGGDSGWRGATTSAQRTGTTTSSTLTCTVMPETRTGEPSTVGTSTTTAPRGVAHVHWTVPTLGARLPQPETREARTTK